MTLLKVFSLFILLLEFLCPSSTKNYRNNDYNDDYYEFDNYDKYEYDNLGYNYRMPSLNAAIGLAQMKKLNMFLSKKRNLYKKYEKRFNNNKYFSLFKEPKNCKSNYWLQTILLNKKSVKLRDKIINKLFKNKIRVRPLWRPIHKSKYLSKMPRMRLESTLDLENRIINLPSSPNVLNKIK